MSIKHYIVAIEPAVRALYQSISSEDTVVTDLNAVISMSVHAASLSVNDVENQRHKAIYDFLYTQNLTVRERENYLAYIDQFIQTLITCFHQFGIRDVGKVQFEAMAGMDIVVSVPDPIDN